MVAALDCPKEFRLRRDRIAETLFTCKLTRCTGCARVELAVPGEEYEDETDRGCKSSGLERSSGDGDNDDDGDYGFEEGGSKESKANSSRGDELVDMNVNQNVSNYSYGEAEALTDEIEEGSQIVGEVLRIKDILLNREDESDSILFESLRKVQLMALSVDTLQATQIGKAVYGLRKHGSKEIRQLARKLVLEWKYLVDEWVNSTKHISQGAEGTPDSVNPSVVDEEEEEEGLPSPPLDEGAFFATPTTGMELSQFFEGMDDDGNPQNGGEFLENRENERKPSQERPKVVEPKRQTPREANLVPKDNRSQQMKRQEAPVKPNNNKPLTTNAAPRRPPRQSIEQKVDTELKFQQKPNKVSPQKKPLNGQKDKLKCSDEDAVREKLEVTKRKLQERYQEAENAKRQRTVQIMQLEDLPKQGLGHKNPHFRQGNHNRHWGNGRR